MVAAAIIGGTVISAGASMIGSSNASSAAQSAADTQAQSDKYAADIQKQIFEEQRSDLAPWRTAGVGALNQINALLGLAPPTQGTTVTTPGATTTTRVPFGGQIPSAILNSNNPIWSAIAQRVTDRNVPGGYRTVTTAGQPTVTTTPGLTSAQQQQAAFDKFRADPGYQFSFDQGQQAIDRSAAARGILNSGATAKALDRFGTGLADQQYSNYFARLQSLAGVGQTATNSGNQAAQNYANNASQLAANAGDARASGYINSANAFSNGLSGVGSAINSGIGNYFALNGTGSGGGTYGANIPYNVNGMVGSYPTINIG